MEDSSEDSEEGSGKNPNPPGAQQSVISQCDWGALLRRSVIVAQSKSGKIFALKKCVGAGGRRGAVARDVGARRGLRALGPHPAPRPGAGAPSLMRVLKAAWAASEWSAVAGSGWWH